MEELKKRVDSLYHDIDLMALWRDVNEQEISKEEATLTRRIQPWLDLKRKAHDLVELASLDDATLDSELSSQADELERDFEELKKELKFKGPYDDHAVIISIYAGAGGTDAQDWAQMLLRMYVRWAEGHKLSIKTIDQSAGEEAGIKSATIEISGGSFLY